MRRADRLRGWLARRLSPPLARVLPQWAARQVRNPIVIIGCGRSGTSLLHSLLGAHHEIAAYPSEANAWWHPSAYPWHRATVDVPPIWVDPRRFTDVSLAARPPDSVRRLQARFGAFQFIARRPALLHKSVMVNFMLPYVLEVFPAARFIHIVRDGRAVALSYAKYQEKTTARARARYVEAGYDWPFGDLVVQFARYWALTIKELDRQRSALGLAQSGRWLEARYETLCTAPRTVLAQVAAFARLSVDGYGLEPHNVVDRNQVYRQELAPAVLARVESEIGPLLAANGYT